MSGLLSESGGEADERRVSALFRPDGSVVVSGRLAGWLRSLALRDLREIRRAGRGGDLARDVLEVLDALRLAEVSDRGPIEPRVETLELEVKSGALITSARAAVVLECDPRSVTRAIAAGRLRGSKVGGQWLISQKELDNFRFGRGSDGQDGEAGN